MKRNKKTTEKFEATEIKRNSNINDDTKKVIAFVILLFVVVGCFIGLYLINGNYVTKDFKDATTTTSEIKFDNKIIAIEDTFNKGDNYLVMLYDKKDEVNGGFYSNLITGYSNTDIKLYSVDMSLKMNSKYYDVKGTSNKTATKYTDLVITEPTMLHIKKGKITEYITEKTEITKLLQAKSKTTTKTSK